MHRRARVTNRPVASKLPTADSTEFMHNFFSAGSPYLNHPLLTSERTAAEVDFVIETLGLVQGSSILDVGCGFGRHSVELAKRGFDVTGIDPSATMIHAASAAAAKAGVTVRFEVASGETFRSEALYDSAICLFTTLGQMTTQDDNRALIANVAAHLKSGGRLVVEVPQREPYLTRLKPAERFGDDKTYTQIIRTTNEENSSLNEHFELVSPSETRHYELHVRLYTQTELDKLIVTAGFEDLQWFADYQGTALDSESPFMLAIGSLP